MQETQPVANRVDRDFFEDFSQRWEEAWNSHEADRVLALMTEDIVYDDSAWPKTMRGHADVQEFLDYTWRAFPDMRFEMVDGPYLHPTAPKACAYWRGFATHTGPIEPPGIAATGRRIEFEGLDVHEYRDGQVARLRIVFDMADVSRQLGLLPAPGSRAERAMAAAQRLQARVASRRR
jgi:steroid delta-isomerase-like uncharacterized protein